MVLSVPNNVSPADGRKPIDESNCGDHDD